MSIKHIAYTCDGCGTDVLATGTKIAKGWIGIRWTEGLIQRPGVKHLPTGRYHFCSQTCLEKTVPVLPSDS